MYKCLCLQYLEAEYTEQNILTLLFGLYVSLAFLLIQLTKLEKVTRLTKVTDPMAEASKVPPSYGKCFFNKSSKVPVVNNISNLNVDIHALHIVSLVLFRRF